MSDEAERNDIDLVYRSAYSVTGEARNVGADVLAERASAREPVLGFLYATQISPEIAAMQQDLHLALDRLGIGRTVAADQVL
jgi:hypothetical protein